MNQNFNALSSYFNFQSFWPVILNLNINF